MHQNVSMPIKTQTSQTPNTHCQSDLSMHVCTHLPVATRFEGSSDGEQEWFIAFRKRVNQLFQEIR